MIVEKISLLVPFVDDQYGTYLQKKVTMDIILQEGETPEKALDYALETVTAWNESTKKAQPNMPPMDLTGLPPHLATQVVRSDRPVPEVERKRKLMDDIYSCTELKVLESYRLLAKSSPELQQSYDEMLKKLS